jgi:manganese transport protein
MIALIIFTSRRDVMGSYAMRPATKWLAFVGATIVLALNFTLLASVFGIRVPFLTV